MTENQIALLDEEDQKFWRNMAEMEEQACLNKLNSGVSCQKYCAYYGTFKCRHPEKVFPHNQSRY